MTDCRDWLSTLWQASFRGFQFYFESDEEEGGRGLVIHEFPNRDAPYVEDLGEAPRYFRGVAYVHGDSADSLAQQFAVTLATRGPATLVTPIGGPVLVRSQTFTREHRRDRLGYAAFRVTFVRNGAASGLISIPILSHLAFSTAQTLAGSIARNFASRVLRSGVADHVVDAAIDGVEMAAAALDGVRETYAVDPFESARMRDLAVAIVDAARPIIADSATAATRADDLAQLVTLAATDNPMTALASAVIEQARGLADAMPAETAMRSMRAIVEDWAPTGVSGPFLSLSAKQRAENAASAASLLRLSAIIAFAEAVIRRQFPDRGAGVDARAEIAARFEQELMNTTGAENADLYRALVELQGRVTDYLSRVINDLAPVIEIEAARIMPSLFWSYRLYRSATRGGEIVARNSVRHPSFIPTRFAALAR